MASIIWDRDPQEAVNNPYEYNAQKQFHREAIALTDKLSEKLLNKKKFTRDDRTLEKALWMLQTDALFAFRDAVQLLDLIGLMSNHFLADLRLLASLSI